MNYSSNPSLRLLLAVAILITCTFPWLFSGGSVDASSESHPDGKLQNENPNPISDQHGQTHPHPLMRGLLSTSSRHTDNIFVRKQDDAEPLTTAAAAQAATPFGRTRKRFWSRTKCNRYGKNMCRRCKVLFKRKAQRGKCRTFKWCKRRYLAKCMMRKRNVYRRKCSMQRAKNWLRFWQCHPPRRYRNFFAHTGAHPVTFEFTMSNRDGYTAADIEDGTGGNTIKADLLGALNLLVSEIVATTFGGNGSNVNKMMRRKTSEEIGQALKDAAAIATTTGTLEGTTGILSKGRRRRVAVMYMEDIPLTIDAVSHIGRSLLFCN